MFHIFVGFIHVIVCFAIIFFVLIQNTKGMGLSGAFGAAGGSDSIFATSGGLNILIKITIVLALIFACTSLGLSFVPPSNPSGGIMANQQNAAVGSGQTIGDMMGGGQEQPSEGGQQQMPTNLDQPGAGEGQPAPPADQLSPDIQPAPGEAEPN